MEYPWAYTLSNCLDCPTLAGAVAPLEHHADLEPFVDHPPLQLDQLNVQLGKLALIDHSLQLPGVACSTDRLGVSCSLPLLRVSHRASPVADCETATSRYSGKNEPEIPIGGPSSVPRGGFTVQYCTMAPAKCADARHA